MTKLITKFKKMDKIDKFGLLFGILILLPCLTALLIDVLINGSKLL